MSVTESKGALMNLAPRIIDYENYHDFVRDFFHFKKAQSKTFSYRRFAALAGIKSSNFLQLVMKNQRRLSPEMAGQVAKAMKLLKPEADYFVALVHLEQSANAEQTMQYDKQKKIAIRKIITKVVPSEKSKYLSVWYFPLIRELAFLADFTCEPSWISKKLKGLVTPTQAQEAIEVLSHLKLWKLNAKNKVIVEDVFMDTGLESTTYQDISITQIHKENLLAWTKIIDTIPKEDRELGMLNIPIHHGKIPEFKKRIQHFQDEIIGWLQDEKDPTQIVQLGTYLVPISTKSNS